MNSFSKYFVLPGWRIGWLVAPEPFMRGIEAVLQNLYIAPHTVSQAAALAAFDECDYFDALTRRYQENRDILRSGLEDAGFKTAAPPQGAFYLYTDVSDLTDDSTAFCRAMLHEAGVAATPGEDFDSRRGKQDVRFSYAGSV